jgi:hypothetical protein
MPLQSLYQEAPLKEYMDLGPGAMMGLGQESFNAALGRQQERNSLVDVYNQQAVNEYNPAEVSRMGLANQQQEYMMPTYQAQGEEAKAKMEMPGFYNESARAKMAGFSADAAAKTNEQIASEAQKPFVAANVGDTADTAAKVAKLQNYRLAVNAFQGSPEQALAMIQKFDPATAKWIKPVIEQQGLEPARKHILSMLDEVISSHAKSDIKYIQETSKEALKQGNKSETDIEFYQRDPAGFAKYRALMNSDKAPAILEVAQFIASRRGKGPTTHADVIAAGMAMNPPPTGLQSEINNLEVVDGKIVQKKIITKEPLAGPNAAQPAAAAAPPAKQVPVTLPQGATLK